MRTSSLTRGSSGLRVPSPSPPCGRRRSAESPGRALPGDEHAALDRPGDAAVAGAPSRTRGGRTEQRHPAAQEHDRARVRGVDHPNQAERHPAEPGPVRAGQPLQVLRAARARVSSSREIVTSACWTEPTAPVSGTRSDSSRLHQADGGHGRAWLRTPPRAVLIPRAQPLNPRRLSERSAAARANRRPAREASKRAGGRRAELAPR